MLLSYIQCWHKYINYTNSIEYDTSFMYYVQVYMYVQYKICLHTDEMNIS